MTAAPDPARAVLFDLDGTLVDAQAAAAAGLRCAMVAWGAPEAPTGPVWARLGSFGELPTLLAVNGAATTR